MNVAVILAGGLGLRMNQSVDLPKQFYQLGDQPVLIHTIRKFEEHEKIDAICVVCLESWEEYLNELISSYGIQKVRWIVRGGETRQESVYNGLCVLEKACRPEDVVLVHDGVRPFITSEIIDENIETALAHNNAMTGYRSTDTLITSHNGKSANSAIDRNSTFTVQTPQTYKLGYGLKQYRRAYAAELTNTINCCELFIRLGKRVFLVDGLKTNMKLTTADDIDYLEALHSIFQKDKER